MNKHLEQAEHNIRLYLTLDALESNDFNDWKSTIIFYAALQITHAYLSQHKIMIPKTHIDLKNELNPAIGNRFPIPYDIYEAYAELENLSRVARYNGMNITPKVYQAKFRAILDNAVLPNYQMLLAHFQTKINGIRGYRLAI